MILHLEMQSSALYQILPLFAAVFGLIFVVPGSSSSCEPIRSNQSRLWSDEGVVVGSANESQADNGEVFIKKQN